MPSASTAPAAPRQRLTPRQCEVLDLLHRGLSNKLIARQLALSDNTVRRHVQDILEYFGVASRAEATYEARRQGLVS
jgi:DNA-binding NarL/FixJ family response regulator